MKTKVLHIILFVISFSLLSFNDPYSIKRISDKEFRYEFYTTKKNIHPKRGKMYFWFKGGAIHQAQSGTSGELLQGKYVKFFHSNQIAEQGYFQKGLKNGIWKTWYKNGILESSQKWSNGLQSGFVTLYNEEGKLIQNGKFYKGLKNGRWIDFVKKDTIYFKNGKSYLPKRKKQKSKNYTKAIKEEKIREKKSSNSFFARLFGKKASKQKTND